MFYVHFLSRCSFYWIAKAHLTNIFLHFVINLSLLFMVTLFVFTVKELLEGLCNQICQAVPLYFLCLPLCVDTSFTLGATKMSAYIILWLFLALFFTFKTWCWFMVWDLRTCLTNGWELSQSNTLERWLVSSSTAIWGVSDGYGDLSTVRLSGCPIPAPSLEEWKRHRLTCGSWSIPSTAQYTLSQWAQGPW